MDFAVEFILKVSLIAIPLYLCNGLALVFGGTTPVDLGKNFFDGRPLLGKGKTFKGTLSGIGFAFLGVLLLNVIFPQTNAIIGANYLYYGSLLAVGAVLGDFAGSFLKRRLGIKRGKDVFMLDQLDFVLGGFAVASILVVPTALEVVFLLAFTMIWHVIGNQLVALKIVKKVPW